MFSVGKGDRCVRQALLMRSVSEKRGAFGVKISFFFIYEFVFSSYFYLFSDFIVKMK